MRVACRNPDAAKFLKPMGDVGQVVPIAANLRDDVSVRGRGRRRLTLSSICVGILPRAGRQSFERVHHTRAPARWRASPPRLPESGGFVHISAIGADPRRAPLCPDQGGRRAGGARRLSRR